MVNKTTNAIFKQFTIPRKVEILTKRGKIDMALYALEILLGKGTEAFINRTAIKHKLDDFTDEELTTFLDMLIRITRR